MKKVETIIYSLSRGTSGRLIIELEQETILKDVLRESVNNHEKLVEAIEDIKNVLGHNMPNEGIDHINAICDDTLKELE